jgi:hypothetical protein
MRWISQQRTRELRSLRLHLMREQDDDLHSKVFTVRISAMRGFLGNANWGLKIVRVNQVTSAATIRVAAWEKTRVLHRLRKRHGVLGEDWQSFPGLQGL